jgi:hypothetical protein
VYYEGNMEGEEITTRLSPEVACQAIRYLGENRCVILLTGTGAVIPISVSHPLDKGMTLAMNALKPLKGVVRMGKFEGEGYSECELTLEWDAPCFPPPQRHKRRRH